MTLPDAYWASIFAVESTATMVSPRTAIALSLSTRRVASMVTTAPCVTIKSTRSCARQVSELKSPSEARSRSRIVQQEYARHSPRRLELDACGKGKRLRPDLDAAVVVFAREQSACPHALGGRELHLVSGVVVPAMVAPADSGGKRILLNGGRHGSER